MNLRETIAAEIRKAGPIPFSRFMELCLYHPELGYYSRPREQFGKAGDFYTSSDLHSIFGRLLGRQFAQMWTVLGSPSRLDLIELGPGRGLFAQDVLDWSRKKSPGFHAALQYTLVESSPGLRARLRERFAQESKTTVVATLEELPSGPENAIVFANEFFDALPVEVVRGGGEPGGEEVLHLGLEGDRFREEFLPVRAEELSFLDRFGIHPAAGERAEVTRVALDYMTRISQWLRRGFLLIVDYGYTREELLAGRRADTVRAFRQHAISDNAYEAPGEQDITANVNFTALRETGQTAGLQPGWILTQSQLLMGIGEADQFADIFAEARLPQERAKLAMQLKHLATPAGMGEIFQVLLMHKGVGAEAAELDGVKFGRE